MNISVIGPGPMADKFTNTLHLIPEIELYGVASRSLERAQEFANRHGYKKAYGSAAELVDDPNVQLVYISTPHSQHFDDMKLCVENGKAVLCEKAFTINAQQAREIKELAEKNNVFVAEAIWTRYMPSRDIINNLLDEGVIGEVTTLTANLCYPVTAKPRIMDPELAGGALLDIGVYGINFALMHFGNEIERIESSVKMTNTGVDEMETITMYFKNGKMAVITSSILSRSDRQGVFYGDKGYMIVDNINNPLCIRIYDTEDNLIREVGVPEQISGYEYQALECVSALENGLKESISMPLNDTICVMEIMDTLRKQWGMVYPQEQ